MNCPAFISCQQSRFLGILVGLQYHFLHTLKLKLPCLTATISPAGCSEWNLLPTGCALTRQIVHTHSLPQQGHFLKPRILPAVQMNVHFWKIMTHDQTNLIKPNHHFMLRNRKHSVTKPLPIVQSFSSLTDYIHVLSNTVAASSLGLETVQPRPV